MSSRRELIVVLAVAAATLGSPGQALAAAGSVIEPDTFADGYANGPGCTLREAIRAANTNNVFDYCHEGSGADTILLEGGVYKLTVGGSEDETAAGDLDVTEDLVIQGVGMHETIIDATDLGHRVFEILAGNVMLADLTITGGSLPSSDGGGIRHAAGTLTLQGVRVTANTAASGGGVVVDAGSLTVRNSLIDGNTATDNNGAGLLHYPIGKSLHIADSAITGNRMLDVGPPGAGIASESGDARIERSLIAGNADPHGAGGIFNDSAGFMRINDSTVHGNSANVDAGGIRTDGALVLTNVTLTDNVGTGVSIYGGDDSVHIANSVFAGNGPNCAGSKIASGGGNMDDGSTCGFDQLTDVSNRDPMLGPLADNGGPTMTLALLPGSPAIGIGKGCSAKDQRGAPRRGSCDSGAYELLTCKSVPVNVLGSAFIDRLVGTPSSDGILAFGGDDFVKGGGGKDTVCGGPGDDVIRGGSGKDTLLGQSGNDKLAGGGGSDRLIGGSGKDRCRQGGGKGKERGCER